MRASANTTMVTARPLSRRRTALGLSLLALVVLLAGARPSAGRAADGTDGKVAGFGISSPGVPQQVIANDLPRMRNDGVNTATIDVWWDVDSDTANTVHPGSITVSDPDLELAIARARAMGFQVMFEPKLWCPSCQPLHWRGILKPSNRSAFFDSYRQMIDHYATLSERAGVSVYFIGSEMETLQDATNEWRHVARDARGLFHGRLAYEVNWDYWDNVHFWDAVDVVSVSAYFPLSDAAQPSVADLKAGWQVSQTKKFAGHTWVKDLAKLASNTKKQILFGECGYLSSTYAARAPYDESQRFDANEVVQANAYQAVLETFSNKPWWMGVVWWEWLPNNPTSDPSASTSYSPRGKLAEQLLTAWYVRGWRPGQPGAPLPLGVGRSALPSASATPNASAARVPDTVAASAAAKPLDLAAATGADRFLAEHGATTGFVDGGVLVRKPASTPALVLAVILLLAAAAGHRRLVLLSRHARRRVARATV